MVILKLLARYLLICPVGWISMTRPLQLGTSSRVGSPHQVIVNMCLVQILARSTLDIV
jgi:hypothetical protein